MDVFSGVLSGSAFAVRGKVQTMFPTDRQGHVVGPYDPTKKSDVGHFIMAIKPDLFLPLDEFKARMQYLYDRVVGSQRMNGVDRVYFPGEIEIEQTRVSVPR